MCSINIHEGKDTFMNKQKTESQMISAVGVCSSKSHLTSLFLNVDICACRKDGTLLLTMFHQRDMTLN